MGSGVRARESALERAERVEGAGEKGAEEAAAEKVMMQVTVEGEWEKGEAVEEEQRVEGEATEQAGVLAVAAKAAHLVESRRAMAEGQLLMRRWGKALLMVKVSLRTVATRAGKMQRTVLLAHSFYGFSRLSGSLS